MKVFKDLKVKMWTTMLDKSCGFVIIKIINLATFLSRKAGDRGFFA
ncbi:MAG: hypothetical protein ABIC82_04980 [bacterium]